MLTKNAIRNLINRYRAVLQNCRLLNVLGALALAGTLRTANNANTATTSYMDAAKAYEPATGTITDLITAYDENGYSIDTSGPSVISFTTKINGVDKPFYILKDGAAMTGDDKTNNRVDSDSVPTDTIYIGNASPAGDANGGAILNNEGNQIGSITGFTFFGNTAANFGGTISNSGENHSLSIIGSTFIANSAIAGGAIYTAGQGYIDSIDNSIFIGNTATPTTHDAWKDELFNGSGGAIYKHPDADSAIGPISNSIFIGNSADNNGGAIFYDIDDYFDRDGGTPVYRTDFSISTTTFIGNTANNNGGAIFFDMEDYLDFDDNLIDDLPYKINNTTFIGNTAGGNGGAIYTKGSIIFNANEGEKVEFTNNKAASDFNAIYVADDEESLTPIPTLDFKLASTGNIYMNDGISGNIAYTVNITGDGTSTGAFYLNDEIKSDNLATVNVNNTTLTLGSYTHNNGETTVGAINGTATINAGSTLKVDANGQTASVSDLTLNEGTLAIENGTLDLSGTGKAFNFTDGTTNTINIGASGTLNTEFNMLGKLDSSAYTFAKTDDAGNALNYDFDDTDGMLILANSGVSNITTGNYIKLMGNIKDGLVDNEGRVKSYTGSVLVDDVTWSGLKELGANDMTENTVVSAGTLDAKTAIVSGIVGGDSTIGNNASLTLTGTMGGVDVALFDGGTLNNEGSTLNLGEGGRTKPLLFNGNLSTSGTTNVNQKTILTGTTVVWGGNLNVNASGTTFGTTTVGGTITEGSLNVSASNTTFGATTLSNGTISVSSDSPNTPNSAVFASLTKGTNAGSLYIENTYSQVTAGIGDSLNSFVGTGGVLNSGAALAQADLDAMKNAMELDTTAVGGGFISAGNAVFVHNSGKTLDMTGGKLIVDSGVDYAGRVSGAPKSGVYFGKDSALIVNTANLGTNAAINGGGATIHIDPSSKLGLLGVKSGEYTILNNFDDENATAGWTEDKVFVFNALYEIEGVSIADSLATDGAYKVTVTKVGAETAFDSMDKNLASALDSYKGGNAFLDNALATSAVNKSTSEKSIEGATKTAVISGLGSAIGHVGTASVGNIEKRNGLTTTFNENDTRYMLAMSGDGVILPMDKAQEGFGIWFMPMYKHSSADGFESGNYKYGYDTNIYGATLGADYTFASSLRLGLAFNVGTGDSESTGDFDTTKNDFDYFGLTAYGNMRFGKLALSADLGYTASSNDINQDNTFGRLSADANAGLLSFGVKGEYGFGFDSFNLTPYAGVRVNYYNIDSFDTKHQGATTASTAQSDYTLVEFPVGLTLDTTLQSGGWDITPSLGLGVKFAAGDLDMDQKVRYTGAQSAVLSSEVADAITFQGALGLDIAKDVYSLGFGYTLDLSENVQSHGVRLDLRYEF